MAIVSDEIMENIKEFLSVVSRNGLHIEKAIVFGPYAKGKQNEWSDIDIAMVSKDFTGVRFYDRKRLNPYLIRIDSRIETHSFRPEDFTKDDLFVVHILKEGIEISN